VKNVDEILTDSGSGTSPCVLFIFALSVLLIFLCFSVETVEFEAPEVPEIRTGLAPDAESSDGELLPCVNIGPCSYAR
jgi:hypothetical protein